MALFPKVARWIRWMYGTPAMLMHNTNDVIMGEEGGYQGDANGGLIHDVGLQGALRDTAEAIVAALGGKADADAVAKAVTAQMKG